MKVNKVSELQVAKKPKNVPKTDKVNKKKSANSSKPKIAKAIQKQLNKVKNIIQNENPAFAKDNDNDEEPISPEDLAKLEKKKAKKTRKNLKKAEAKAEKEKINMDSKVSTNQRLIKEVNTDTSPTQAVSKTDKRNPVMAAATVFVGNLPINTKRVQLIRLFKEYGEVVSIRIRTAGGKNLFKHKTRKEAGSLIAFVQLKSAEAAKKSLSLNGTEFKTNHLRVTLSNDKSNYDTKRTIFVGNLKYSATEEKLREIFSSCGEIEYVRCLQDREKGCKAVAYVCFKAPDAVGLALELNETVLDDRPIHVERYSLKKLGAKQKRDVEATEQQIKKSKGAFKRLQQKKSNSPQKTGKTEGLAQKKKKKEFLGVKVNSLQKKHKKKANDQMKKLAAKIAPKAKPNIIA